MRRRRWLGRMLRGGVGACFLRMAGAVAVEPAGGDRLDGLRLVQAQGAEATAAPADAAASLAVVYPDIPEPYRSVFLQIVEGIEDAAKTRLRVFAVGAQADPAEFAAQLRRGGAKAVIALGRQGLKLASTLPPDLAVTVGGVLSLPEAEQRSLSGISLTPDPALLFSKLRGLQPAARRVWVVYDPRYNDWLIRAAREAAKGQGLEFKAVEANSLAESVKAYEQLFAAVEPRRDAVWLPQDPTSVDEQTVLPLVLRESWERGMPVFSSNYQHVKKGALFVLYPHNQELGRSLAAMALKGLAGEGRKGVLPLRDVFAALNLRTANHLGLNIGMGKQREFDTVFP